MSKYHQLTLKEKQKMIGELQDAIMCSDQIFHWASELIEAAKYAGIIKAEICPTNTEKLEPVKGVKTVECY